MPTHQFVHFFVCPRIFFHEAVVDMCVLSQKLRFICISRRLAYTNPSAFEKLPFGSLPIITEFPFRFEYGAFFFDIIAHRFFFAMGIPRFFEKFSINQDKFGGRDAGLEYYFRFIGMLSTYLNGLALRPRAVNIQVCFDIMVPFLNPCRTCGKANRHGGKAQQNSNQTFS